METGRKSFGIAAILLLIASLVACASFFDGSPAPTWDKKVSVQYRDGKFHNQQRTREMSFLSSVRAFWHLYTEKDANSQPGEMIDIVALTGEELHQAPDLSLWRLGHSTLLLKLAGKFWLTDPVFADRASPFGFIGPRRFHAPPIAREDLPEIEAVILSHDHYDHLDQQTVLALAPKVKRYLAPLGVGDRIIGWGVPPDKVQQFDWWEETQIGSVKLIATPAQHFSGRSLGDRNSTLWSSWVVMTPETRLFFSGDSGYFDGFNVIGERFGPFDLTLLENGAYNRAWSEIHMHPEETVQAHLDLRGKRLVPIHNGTFDLSIHNWTEPLERVSALAQTRGVALSTPRMGERLDVRRPAAGAAWWRDRQAQVVSVDSLLTGQRTP